MPLPTGKWTVNLNGTEGELRIDMMNVDGSFTGSLIATAITGFWNEITQTISFELGMPELIVPIGAVQPQATRGHFVGYLFSTPAAPVPGSDIKWTLTGFVSFPPGQGIGLAQPTSRRDVFGWFAEITQIV